MIFAALLGLAFGQDAFIQFITEYGKEYTDTRNFTTRRDIFMKSYQAMLEYNTRYEAGEVTWACKVTKFYDMTYEEFASAVGIGMNIYTCILYCILFTSQTKV